MHIPAEPPSLAERIEHGLLGLYAVLFGAWLTPRLLDGLDVSASRNNADLIAALSVLFLVLGLLLLVTVHTARRILGWPLARAIAIPLGAWRSASYLARHSQSWERDPEGGAALAGALALLRRNAHDPAAASMISEQVTSAQAIGTAGITAAGLLAAGRGDRLGARALLHSALQIEGKKALPRAQGCARAWLIADAAARGEWRHAVVLGDAPWTSLGVRARFLAAVAARFVGAHSPTDTGLWLLWIACPSRGLVRPLLDAARAIPQALHPRRFSGAETTPTIPPETDALPDLPTSPLPRALVLHAHWTGRDPLHLRLVPERLVDLLRAWDSAHRCGDLMRQINERAGTLGIPTRSAELHDRFLGEVAADLAQLTIGAAVPLGDHLTDPGEVSLRVTSEIRARMLSDVEEDTDRLGRRAETKSALPAVDEWREWNQLRQRYELAGRLGGLDLRRLMFPEVHRVGCSFAVWLWNDRKEYGISTPIFRWLLAEAEAVGDSAAIDLQRRNLGIKT